jgi:hypothetical protein
VRFSVLVWFAAACGFSGGVALCADLQKEDLRSIQESFRKADASLDWFEASAKKPIDADRSAMVVLAAPTELRPVGIKGTPARVPVPGKAEIGVFVVSGVGNRVQLRLDLFSANEVNDGTASVDETGTNSISLGFYSDYGIYSGSIRYFYDLSGGKLPRKIRYGKLALTSSSIRNGTLIYGASSSGWSERHATVTIDPRAGEGRPAFKIVDVPASDADAVPQPVELRLPDGGSVQVVGTPPGQTHQPAGFAVSDKSGKRQVFIAPVPTMEMYRKLRPKDQAPLEIENDMGPVALDGSTVWFANHFYDGEGTSGVGAIGTFDVRTHKFEMRYLPEITAWSGSAIRLDGENLWVGLMRQPEGAAYGGGLLRYDRRTGATAKYEIPDYIYTIDRVGDTIYCGTENGLYSIRGSEITHLSFEPDVAGRVVGVRAGQKPGGRAEALIPLK